MKDLSPFWRAAGRAARRATGAGLLLGLSSAVAWGAPSGVRVSGGWMRVLIPGRPAAGYFTLTNESTRGVTLVGASSPGCATLMLHESVQQGGMDMMRMVSALKLPPNGTLRFEPGAYHLMCMQPAATLKPGGTVAVTLRFAGGDTLSAPFTVRGPTAQ